MMANSKADKKNGMNSARATSLEAEQHWWLEQEMETRDGPPTLLQKIIALATQKETQSLAWNIALGRLYDRLRSLNLQGKEILDCACGAGWELEKLLKISDRVCATDISEVALEKCRSRFSGVPLIRADAMSLPFPQSAFDCIVVNFFMHHVVEDGFEPYLAEFRRVLRRGGVLVIQDPNILYPISGTVVALRWLMRRPRLTVGEVQHERPFSPFTLVKKLQDGGYTNIQVETSSFAHPYLFLPLAKAIHRAERPFLKAKVLKYLGWNLVYTAETL